MILGMLPPSSGFMFLSVTTFLLVDLVTGGDDVGIDAEVEGVAGAGWSDNFASSAVLGVGVLVCASGSHS